MGLKINTNVQALKAHQTLDQIGQRQDKALVQLSSGNRISQIGDDVAGLTVAERLKSQIVSSAQARRNASEGVSVIQTAEGGMVEVQTILTRLRELSIQGASDNLGDPERALADKEFQNLTAELERITQTTAFNGVKLLNGEGSYMDFQIGIHGGENSRIGFDSGSTAVTSEDLGVAGMSVADKSDAQSNLEGIDEAMKMVGESRANLGALQNRMQSTIRNLDVRGENMSEARSRIADTDIARVSSELVKENILSSAATSVLAQANQTPRAALKLLGN